MDENKDKYGKSIGFVKGLYDKFTPNKVERELLLGISGEKIVLLLFCHCKSSWLHLQLNPILDRTSRKPEVHPNWLFCIK